MSRTDRLAAANKARGAYHAQRSFAAARSGYARGNSPRVRRGSRYAGEYEVGEWRRHNVFTAAERLARLQALREWNYKRKEAGKPWGPLGPSGERFIDSLMGLRCFRTGRLDLSVREIAAKLHMCVQTVVSYTAKCVDLGLMVKLRRSAPIEDPEPGGPLVEQITNAYWFQLPPGLAERVRQILGKDIKPVDQEEHEKAQAELLETMLSTLSCEELARFRAGDTGAFATQLASLGRAVDRGKSAILTARNSTGRQG